MGEKGSIKNLYKAWRLFLEERKKKKKEKQKNKKTSKVKVFVVTFLTFLLSPFFFGSKKKEKKSMKQIDVLISEIDKENNPEILVELKKVLENEKEKVQESELKQSKKAKKIKLIEKAESKIENKIEIFRKEEENVKSSDLKSIDEHNNMITTEIKKDIAVGSVTVNEKTLTFKDSEMAFEMRPELEIIGTKITQHQVPIVNDPDILEFLNYMKLEINTVEYKLKGDLNIFGLKYLKSRIVELNNKRENFKINYDFSKISELYKNKDKYKILDNNNVLENMYKECDLKIEKINQEKNNDKKEKKNKRIKHENINFIEIEKVNKYLEKEIEKQQLQISKLKLIILKAEKKLKRPTILMNVKNMITNSMKICLGLLPLPLFKNKLIAGLVSSFMFNNSIRSIRNLVNEEQIEYAKLLSNINNQKDLIFHTRLVYEDALTQIEFLKYDLLCRFSFTDLKDIFHKLYEMGEELKKKNKMLSDLEIELEEQYDKTREKVKKYAA